METVDRTYFHAVHVFALDAVFGNDESHELLLIGATMPKRGTVAATARKSKSFGPISANI
jgi:hypothetical protein